MEKSKRFFRNLTPVPAEQKFMFRAEVPQRLRIEILEKTDNHEFLESLIENIPNMIFVKDAKTLRFVRFNKAGEELLGYRREELLGKSDYDFFPREQAEHFISYDRAVLERREIMDIPQERITTKDNKILFLHTQKIPIYDRKGRPLYLLGISEDVTQTLFLEEERRILQREAMAKSEAEKVSQRLSFLSEGSALLNSSLDSKKTLQSLAHLVVNHMADCCLVDWLDETDKPANLIMIHRNPEKEKLLNEIIEKYPRDWNRGLGPARVLQSGQSELHSHVSSDLIKFFARNEDHARMLEKLQISSAMIVPIGTHARTIGTIAFISCDPNRSYCELDLSLAEDLAKRVSLAIENAQLFKRAQEANRAKSTFLANMSHEIRTPLGAMLGFAEILSEGGNLTSDQQKSLQTILRNGRQLFQIVDEILDLSKVEADKVSFEMIRFSLADVIHDVTALLTVKAREKNIQLNVQPLSPLPNYVISDPTRTRQILINVIGNAIKFTHHGEVVVTLASRALEEDSGFFIFEVSVRDSGVGITPEQASQLFQPFSQGDSSMNRRFGGTGLGLCLSRRFARALGGDVFLKESSNAGSTFVILQKMRYANTAHSEGHTHKDFEVSDKVPPIKVLVVDDSMDNRSLLSHYIEKSGGTVEQASNGKEGVEKAMAGNFDIILMDLQMPELDGIAATQILRVNNYRKPIVAVTAHAMKGDRENCLAQGFDSYLAKPVSRSALLEVLSNLHGKMNGGLNYIEV